MIVYIFLFLFFAIPTAFLVGFGISLYRYLSAKRRNKQTPGTFSPEEIKKRSTVVIVLAVTLGVLLAVVIGFIVLIYMAIAFM